MVESVYSRLEPLLPQVRKPVQYIGGELNSVVKDWESADVRWALMYPDAYEVGLPNQGLQILYEVLNGCDGVLAERTYSVWPDLEALMREPRHPPVHGGRAPAGGRVRPAGRELRHRVGVHEPADRAGPGRHPAGRGRPGRPPSAGAGRRARRVQPRADRRVPRRRGARRRRAGRADDQRRWSGTWKAAGPSRRPGRPAAAAGRRRRGVRAAVLRRGLPGRRPDRQRPAEPAGRARFGGQAHPDGPGRLGLPEQAAGPGGRDRARAVQRGDLPRLHQRLPVLPGRHDHPAGPRAQQGHDLGHGG